MNGLVMKEFTALSPKVYSIITQYIDKKNQFHDNYNKNTLKGVSKVVVDKDINHHDYNSVLEENITIKKDVMSIRSFNHQLYTFQQSKIALTSFYDKLCMLDPISCVPFGYDPR